MQPFNDTVLRFDQKINQNIMQNIMLIAGCVCTVHSSDSSLYVLYRAKCTCTTCIKMTLHCNSSYCLKSVVQRLHTNAQTGAALSCGAGRGLQQSALSKHIVRCCLTSPHRSTLCSEEFENRSAFPRVPISINIRV